MSAVQDWAAALKLLPTETLTAEQYEALPEDVCRRIEVVDGAVVVTPAARRPHNRIARRLANAFEDVADHDFAVETDVDLRLRDVPLSNRRPDVVVYDSALSDGAVLRPEHCLLVVEVVSPGSTETDKVAKPYEYPVAGIKHFWRVENPDDSASNLTIFRYRLLSAGQGYTSVGVDTGKMTVDDPFPLEIDFADLLRRR